MPVGGCINRGRKKRASPEEDAPLASKTISRVLCASTNRGRRPSVCGLGYPRPDATNPGASRAPIAPLHGLAPGGVCPAGRSPDRWCALTAPFHPYSEVRGHPGTPLKGRQRPRTDRAVCLCGTFRRVAAPGRYPAPCPYGARTFLPFERFEKAAARPPGSSHCSVSGAWV